MKKSLIFLGTTLFFSCNNSSNNAPKNEGNSPSSLLKTAEETLKKTYIGKIDDKYGVVFEIITNGETIKGVYFYEKKGMDISLKGTNKNGRWTLEEEDYAHNTTAKIEGQLNGAIFAGEWIDLKTNKHLPLTLTETPKIAPVLPAKIEGVYQATTMEESSNCAITVAIRKEKGEYLYDFQSTERKLHGKVTFFRDLEDRQVYITLEGITWSEYGGDLDQADKRKTPLKLPIGIDGMFSQDTISIQNYGNSMNYYTKLSDCGAKYVFFVRK